ncbi:uncharacterized protein [Panulirus ornatus]|uniref:uncharacterized protein n=1 Tax=Panulirus ornatus TaxID=150431 RepID=UPI003A8BDA18
MVVWQGSMGQSAHAPPGTTWQRPLLLLVLMLTVSSASHGGHEVSQRILPAPGPPRLRGDAASQESVFPYAFEKIAMAAQKTKKVELGTPYAIKKRTQQLGDVHRRLDMQEEEQQEEEGNGAQHSTPLSRDDSNPTFQRHKKRPASGSSLWPSRPAWTNTELTFVGILAAVLVKLVLSTALATWFLAAGQALYGVASLTGTTAVFGMDSTIGYIYKTLPYIEALLRGEATFHS